MIEIPVFECGALTLWISPLLFHAQALSISSLPPSLNTFPKYSKTLHSPVPSVYLSVYVPRPAN